MSRVSSADRPTSGPSPVFDAEGFALGIVVLLLFAIGVAGAAGYQIVFANARQALQGYETAQALNYAESGLRRYFSEQAGDANDGEIFTFGRGSAAVSVRKVMDTDWPNDLWEVASTGTYEDPRTPTAPASRTIVTYAERFRVPASPIAALAVAGGNVTLAASSGERPTVTGIDSGWGACSERGTDLAGIATNGTVTVQAGTNSSEGAFGSPATATYGSAAAALEAMGLDWSDLLSGDLPVDHEDSWPASWTTSTDYRVLRFNTSVSTPNEWYWKGRGILIVDGTLTINPRTFCFEGICYSLGRFDWDGLIIVDELASVDNKPFLIYGGVIAGADGAHGPLTITKEGYIRSSICTVLEASEKLARFIPRDRVWIESY